MSNEKKVVEQPESAIYSGAAWRAFLLSGGDADSRESWVWFLKGYQAHIKGIAR